MPQRKESNGDYSKALRKLLASMNKDFRLSKDGSNYLVSIMELINECLIDFTKKESKKSAEITCFDAAEAVRRLPKKIADCAQSEGNKALLKLDQHELVYKGPEKPRTKMPQQIKPEMFKKGLIELASDTHRDCELTVQATKLGCDLIYNLAQTFISRAILDVQGESEMTVDHMRASVGFTMSPELLELAECHGQKLLDFYDKGMLDFDIRTVMGSLEENGTGRRLKPFEEGCQKLSSEQYGVTLEKNALEKLESVLTHLATRIAMNAGSAAMDSSSSLNSVTGIEAFTAVKMLFPEEVFCQADNYGRMNVFNYVCGHLKYTRTSRPSARTSAVESEAIQTIRSTSINFRSSIRTNAPHLVFLKSSLGHLNDILNALCKKLVAESVALCNSVPTRLMTRFEVLETVRRILPGELSNHAIAHLKSVEEGLSRIEEEQGSQLPQSLFRDKDMSVFVNKEQDQKELSSMPTFNDPSNSNNINKKELGEMGLELQANREDHSPSEESNLEINSPHYWSQTRPWEFLPGMASSEEFPENS